MKRYRSAVLPALLSLFAGACSERTGSPVDVGAGTALSFAPRFASFGAAQSSAPINLIRLTARNITTNAIVAALDTTVNPDAAEWEINLQVPPDAGTVRVLVELINKVGTTEIIEWSGLTAPIEVQAGGTSPTQITLFRGPPSNINVTQVVITPNGLTLPEGTGGQLSATASPGGVVFWSSLDPLVATVNATGGITTLRDGTARMVAEAGPKADTVVVTVTQVVASVAATPDSARLTSLGAEALFSAAARDVRGADIMSGAITWSLVSGNGVVQDLGGGRFRALANGRAEVRASSAANPAIGDNAIINVGQRGAQLQLNPGSAALNAVGATQQFTAAVQDANGNAMTAPVVWRTVNAAVATVDANGLVTARGAGATDLVAVINAGNPDSVVAHAALSVAQEVRSIALSPGSAVLDAFGQTLQLTAQALDAGGIVVADAIITWTSVGGAVSLTDSGLITALGNGIATIIASAGSARATTAITVQQRAAAVTVAPALDSIGAGETAALTADVEDSGGSRIEAAAVTWTSSNDAVATVDAAGVVTGHAAGTALITATSDGVSASATIVVTGTVITNLTAVSITTHPVNPLVEGEPVAVTLTITNNGTSPSPATTIRLAVLDAVPPHALLRDSIIPLPSIPAGATVSFARNFTLASFAGLPDSVKIAFVIDPENLIAESDEGDNIAMSETKTLSFVQFTWVGGSGSAWETPANWSPAAVPHARSNVLIPGNGSIYPVLSSSAEIAQLTQDAGTTLTINTGQVLTVTGMLDGVNVTGPGTVKLASSQEVAGALVSANTLMPAATTVSGTVFHLEVEVPIALAADFRANGNTLVTPAGALYVGPYLLRIDGDLQLDGILDMSDAAARAVIGLTATFSGVTSMVGHLTAGELFLLGDLRTIGANAFPAHGTHLTVFSNANAASAELSTLAGNHFQHVRIEKPNLFTILSDIVVNGTVRVAAVTPEVLSTMNVTIGGDLELLGSTFWHVQSTTFTGDPVFPADMVYGVTFTGNAMLRQHTSIGGVGIYGNLNLNGFNLNAGSIFTSGGGTLEMRAGETLNVAAHALFDGATTEGKLTSGRINFHGQFSAGPAGAFSPSSGFEAFMMGSDAQTIAMQNGNAIGGNHFADLYIRNSDGVTLATDIVVTGKLEMDQIAPLLGAGRTLTSLGDIVDQSSCPCNLPETPTSAGDVPALTPAQNAAALTGQNYHVTNTVLAGSSQALPNFIDTNLSVVSNLTFAGITTVGGNVSVSGNLRLGGALGEECPTTYVLVIGNFSTTGSGTLEMLCAHDAFLTLDVDGNIDFMGGSETGRLRNGRLEVGGSFTADGPSPTAFVSEGTALWLAPYADQGGQTITLSAPMQQTLRDVLIRRGGQTGELDIDFVNGAHVYGRFDVDSPSGAFINLSSSTGATLYVHGIDTCDDECWYGMFQLYSARIDRMPIHTEHAAVYIQYITFGDYAPNVDQFTMIEVEQSPYFTDVEFETVPGEGNYHLRASGTGANIVVNNPTPATEADGARWLDENGARIIWGQEPNLTVVSMSVPTSVTIGQTIELYGLIANEGFDPAGGFNVRVRILDAATGLPVANVPVLNAAVPGIPGGNSIPVSQNVTIAATPLIVWPAAIKAEILLDSADTVAETNERDNGFITGAVTVNPLPSNVVGGARTQRPASNR